MEVLLDVRCQSLDLGVIVRFEGLLALYVELFGLVDQLAAVLCEQSGFLGTVVELSELIQLAVELLYELVHISALTVKEALDDLALPLDIGAVEVVGALIAGALCEVERFLYELECADIVVHVVGALGSVERLLGLSDYLLCILKNLLSLREVLDLIIVLSFRFERYEVAIRFVKQGSGLLELSSDALCDLRTLLKELLLCLLELVHALLFPLGLVALDEVHELLLNVGR